MVQDANRFDYSRQRVKMPLAALLSRQFMAEKSAILSIKIIDRSFIGKAEKEKLATLVHICHFEALSHPQHMFCLSSIIQYGNGS